MLRNADMLHHLDGVKSARRWRDEYLLTWKGGDAIDVWLVGEGTWYHLLSFAVGSGNTPTAKEVEEVMHNDQRLFELINP